LYRESSTNITHMDDFRSVSSSNNKFSVSLYDLLKSKEGNLPLSPFSVSAVMAMVSAGARSNTFTQLMKGFSFPIPNSLQLGDTGPVHPPCPQVHRLLHSGVHKHCLCPEVLFCDVQDILEKICYTSRGIYSEGGNNLCTFGQKMGRLFVLF
jgi:hypothetical protein